MKSNHNDLARQWQSEERGLPHDPNGYESELPFLMPGNGNGHKPLPRRLAAAEDLQRRYRSFSSTTSAMFVKLGLIAYKIRYKGYWQDLGYKSFDEWCVSPEQNATATEGNLQAQVIDLCVMYFRLHVTELYGVGFKKWMLITPHIEGLRADVAAFDHKIAGLDERIKNTIHPQKYELLMDRLETLREKRDKLWQDCRVKTLEWIALAETTSWSGLQDEGFNAKGWETFYRESISVGLLRQTKTVEELLDMLGLSDRTDEFMVRISIRGRKRQKNGNLAAAKA